MLLWSLKKGVGSGPDPDQHQNVKDPQHWLLLEIPVPVWYGTVWYIVIFLVVWYRYRYEKEKHE
jgi:hypothetical protein